MACKMNLIIFCQNKHKVEKTIGDLCYVHKTKIGLNRVFFDRLKNNVK